MAEFWEQQLMDRCLALYFEARNSKEQVMPAKQMKDIFDYVKFLLRDQKLLDEYRTKKGEKKEEIEEVSETLPIPNISEDLRGVGCPMNFVKAKMFLSKMKPGETLQLLLDDGEPIQNVPNSLREEGHKILSQRKVTGNSWNILVDKKKEEKMEKIILKVLVGSQAHGLADKNSDYDYRSVYVTPTSEILELNNRYKGNHWQEGTNDQTGYEIGNFLFKATKCIPNILEIFKAPIYVLDKEGNVTLDLCASELRDLFPNVWHPQKAYEAYKQYASNQLKKFTENKDDEWKKFAVAYLRTFWNLEDLLREKTFSLEIKDKTFKEQLLEIKAGKWTKGKVLDMGDELKTFCKCALEDCKHEPDYTKVNNFLLKIRKEFWE